MKGQLRRSASPRLERSASSSGSVIFRATRPRRFVRTKRFGLCRPVSNEALPLTTFLLHCSGRGHKQKALHLQRTFLVKRFGSGIQPTGSASPPADFHGPGRRHSSAEALRSEWLAGNSSLLQVIKTGLELKHCRRPVTAKGVLSGRGKRSRSKSQEGRSASSESPRCRMVEQSSSDAPRGKRSPCYSRRRFFDCPTTRPFKRKRCVKPGRGPGEILTGGKRFLIIGFQEGSASP